MVHNYVNCWFPRRLLTHAHELLSHACVDAFRDFIRDRREGFIIVADEIVLCVFLSRRA